MTTDSTADGHVAPEPPDGAETTEHSDNAASHEETTWERALYMLLFGFVGYFTFWAIVLIAVVQLVVTFVNKRPNEDLLNFSDNLSVYLAQIASYLGYVSDEKPCPFSPFPRTTD